MAKLNKADAMALISSFHRHGQCAQAVSVRRAFRRGCAGSAAATVRRAFRRGHCPQSLSPRQQRSCVTHVAAICDDTAVQPSLPQV